MVFIKLDFTVVFKEITSWTTQHFTHFGWTFAVRAEKKLPAKVHSKCVKCRGVQNANMRIFICWRLYSRYPWWTIIIPGVHKQLYNFRAGAFCFALQFGLWDVTLPALMAWMSSCNGHLAIYILSPTTGILFTHLLPAHELIWWIISQVLPGKDSLFWHSLHHHELDLSHTSSMCYDKIHNVHWNLFFSKLSLSNKSYDQLALTLLFLCMEESKI